jgi:microcompartment protein CcmL/EutN
VEDDREEPKVARTVLAFSHEQVVEFTPTKVKSDEHGQELVESVEEEDEEEEEEGRPARSVAMSKAIETYPPPALKTQDVIDGAGITSPVASN